MFSFSYLKRFAKAKSMFIVAGFVLVIGLSLAYLQMSPSKIFLGMKAEVGCSQSLCNDQNATSAPIILSSVIPHDIISKEKVEWTLTVDNKDAFIQWSAPDKWYDNNNNPYQSSQWIKYDSVDSSFVSKQVSDGVEITISLSRELFSSNKISAIKVRACVSDTNCSTELSSTFINGNQTTAFPTQVASNTTAITTEASAVDSQGTANQPDLFPVINTSTVPLDQTGQTPFITNGQWSHIPVSKRVLVTFPSKEDAMDMRQSVMTNQYKTQQIASPSVRTGAIIPLHYQTAAPSNMPQDLKGLHAGTDYILKILMPPGTTTASVFITHGDSHGFLGGVSHQTEGPYIMRDSGTLAEFSSGLTAPINKNGFLTYRDFDQPDHASLQKPQYFYYKMQPLKNGFNLMTIDISYRVNNWGLFDTWARGHVQNNGSVLFDGLDN